MTDKNKYKSDKVIVYLNMVFGSIAYYWGLMANDIIIAFVGGMCLLSALIMAEALSLKKHVTREMKSWTIAQTLWIKEKADNMEDE